MIALGILAGGHSRRWGGHPKAIADHFDAPLVMSVVHRLHPLPLLGLCIRSDQTDWAQSLDIPLIIEQRTDHPEGPLKGIFALLSTMPTHTEWLLVTPCDMPWIPNNIAQTLHWQATQKKTTLVTLGYADGQHSLVLLIHKSEQTALDHYLKTGQQRVGRWLAQRNAYCYPWTHNPNALSNLNQPPENTLHESPTPRR